MYHRLLARTVIPFSLTLLSVIVLLSYRTVAMPSRPLSKAELLALVAGNVLAENAAFEIRSRGLAFAPDLAYNSLLTQAGADPRVFAALNSAKTSSPRGAAEE